MDLVSAPGLVVNGRARAVPLLLALAIGAGLAAGWSASRLSAQTWEQLTRDPMSTVLLAAVVLIVGSAVVLALLRRPTIALVVLVIGIWTNLSEILVRFHGWPSLLQLVSIPILLTALWYSKESAEHIVRSPLFLAATAWLIWNGASFFWALSPEAALERTVELWKAWLVLVIVSLLASSLYRLRRATWSVVGSATVLALLGAWQVLSGRFSQEFGGLARVKNAQIFGTVFEPRIAGPLGDPNFFAQILLMAVPLALAMGWVPVSKSERSGLGMRMLSLALAAVLLTGLLLTYSRGAAVAMVLVLASALILRGVRWRHLLVGSAVLLIVLLAAPFGFVRRLETLRQFLPGAHAIEAIHPDSSFAKRRLVTATAWMVFSEHPILGVGAGNYGEAFFDSSRSVGTDAELYGDPGVQNYPHNLYLETAAETGGVGVLLFGLVIVSAGSTLWLVRRQAGGEDDVPLRGLADGLSLAIAGFLVTALFLHWEFPRYFSLVLGLVAGLGAASANRVGNEAKDRGSQLRDAPAAERRGFPSVPSRPPLSAPIAVFVSRFPKLTETFILREIDELERQGQPVVLVPLIRHREPLVHEQARRWLGRAVFTPWASRDILRANGVWLMRRPGRYLSTLFRLVGETLFSPAICARTLALFPKAAYLAERLPAQGVGHVHAHFATHPTTAALIVHRLSGVTFSFTTHAHDIFVRRDLLGWKIRESAFVRVISEFNRHYLAERYPDHVERFVVIHMGVDVADSEVDAGDVRRPPALGEPVVLCVAALKGYKGLGVLIEACGILVRRGCRFRCQIVGDGPERESLLRQVNRLNLQEWVRLEGPKTESEVRQAMQTAAVVVQPSVVAKDGQMEGIPVALMEAQARAIPVIASRLSGIPELVRDGRNGLLVEPGDAEGLATGIERILSDPELYQRLGREGLRTTREEFALPQTASSLRRELARYNPPVQGARAELAWMALHPDESGGVVRVHQSPDAVVVEVLASDGGSVRRRYVKRALRRDGASRPPAGRAAREAAALSFLSGGLAGGPFRVPELLAVRAADGVVVTTACAGRRLDDLLRDARSRPVREALSMLVTPMCAAGAWLREFQNLELPPLPGDQVDDIASHPLGSDLVPSHGDFWPGNVLYDEGMVCVVDLEGAGRRPRGYDAAWFLVHLQRYLRRPWDVRLWVETREAFIKGWGGEQTVDRVTLQHAYSAARRRMRRAAIQRIELDSGLVETAPAVEMG